MIFAFYNIKPTSMIWWYDHLQQEFALFQLKGFEMVFLRLMTGICFGCLGLIGSCQVQLQTFFSFFFGWYHWLGKHNSNIWNLVLGCLMWTIWTERNQRSFENTGKFLAQLLDLCHRTFFYWSRCWGLSDCFTLMDFLLSLRIV